MITITLSEAVVRKARALAILTGANPANFEETLLGSLEAALDHQILSALGQEAPVVVAPTTPIKPTTPVTMEENEIAEGLGDEDDASLEGLKDVDALVPTQGGLTDEDLDKDMQVDDPEHEAKVDAGTFAEELSGPAENAFTAMMGLPPIDPDEVDHRILKRKKRSKSRAKVSAFNGDEAV